MTIKILIIGLVLLAAMGANGQSKKELQLRKELKAAPTDLTESGTAFNGPLRLAFGDLTGDGVEEIVALFRGSRAGWRIRDDLRIFEVKRDTAVLLARFNASADGEYVLSIAGFNSNFTVEDTTLVIDQAVLVEGECTPSHYQTVKFRVVNGRLKEVDRSKLIPLPEHMREIG